MSGPTRIDLHAATPVAAPADGLEPPFADPAALAWLCPSCGKLRVFEGGRPLGGGDPDDCWKCGSRLAVAPELQPAVAKAAADRYSVRALIDRYAF